MEGLADPHKPDGKFLIERAEMEPVRESTGGVAERCIADGERTGMGKIRRCVIAGVTIAFCADLLLPVGHAQMARPSMKAHAERRASFRNTEDSALVAYYGWIANVPSPAVTVVPAATSVTEQQSFVVTVQVAGETGVPAPTGTVVLYAGNFQTSAALSGGEASLTVPGGVLTAGTNVLTASYTPDAASSLYYGGASGRADVVVHPAPAYFGIAGSAITLSRGQVTGNTVAVTVHPYRGFTGVVDLTAAITSAPKVVHDLPTLSFGSTNPVRIVGASAGTAILTITTTGSGGSIADGGPGSPFGSSGGVAFAVLVVMTWPVRRRKWMRHRWMRSLHLIAVGVFSLWLMGCGVTAKTGGDGGTTPGNYTVTVTGSATGVSSTGAFTVTVR